MIASSIRKICVLQNYFLSSNRFYHTSIPPHINFHHYENQKFKQKYESIYGKLSQASLRSQFINTTFNQCLICKQHYPFHSLELAHIKPKSQCKEDFCKFHPSNVCFMCPLCHNLYDRGLLGVLIDKNKPLSQTLLYDTKTELKINSALKLQIQNHKIANNEKMLKVATKNINDTLGMDMNTIRHKIVLSDQLLEDIVNGKYSSNTYFNTLNSVQRFTRDNTVTFFPQANAVFNSNLYTNGTAHQIREIKWYHLMKLWHWLEYHYSNIFKH